MSGGNPAGVFAGGIIGGNLLGILDPNTNGADADKPPHPFGEPNFTPLDPGGFIPNKVVNPTNSCSPR